MRRRPDGFVLVCVLWVLAILTVLTLGFAHRVLLDRRAAALSVDHFQAQAMARGAVERALVELRSQFYAQEIRQELRRRRIPGAPVESVAWQGLGTLDLLKEGLCFTREPGDEGDVCFFEVEDVERRICLNTAPEEMLDEIETMDFSTVDKILRRRGRKGGLETPHPFVAVEELRALDGIDDDVWYGDGHHAGLRDLFTVWGDGLINVNTASRAVLECIPDIRDDVVEAILSYRAGADGQLGTSDDQMFRTLHEIGGIARVSQEKLAPVLRYCKVESLCFRITGTATRRQGKVVARCVAVVQITNGAPVVLEWREGTVDS